MNAPGPAPSALEFALPNQRLEFHVPHESQQRRRGHDAGHEGHDSKHAIDAVGITPRSRPTFVTTRPISPRVFIHHLAHASRIGRPSTRSVLYCRLRQMVPNVFEPVCRKRRTDRQATSSTAGARSGRIEFLGSQMSPFRCPRRETAEVDPLQNTPIGSR